MIGLAAAQEWIEQRFARLGTETVALGSASGRVLATGRPPLAPGPPIAVMAGYAVRAAATEGASDYAPLPIIAVPIQAGAELPPETDAVLPAHSVEAGAALAACAAGEGVASHDTLAVAAGVLRPAALAALARRGETAVEAIRRPAVRLVGSDALAPMLHALVEIAGGYLDDGAPDLLLYAGRSDAPEFERVFASGIRIRPGEATTLGTVDGIPALKLPDEPLACQIAFTLLAAPALRRLAGRSEPRPVMAILARKIVSGLGQVEVVRITLSENVATPSGPSLAAAADGLVLVPEGSEGYPVGATVSISPLP